jgi:uncharacterized membrane protein
MGPPPGGMPPQPDSWDVGACLNWAWTKFQGNVAQLILAVLAVMVTVTIVGGIAFFLALLAGEIHFILGMAFGAVAIGVTFLVAQVLGAGMIRGALGVTEGREFQVAEVFRFEKVGAVVVTALIVAGATAVGYLLCYLPGLIVAFVTSYALFFVIDKDLEPVEAIKASFELVKNNFADTIIWYLIVMAITAVGAALCYVGLLVAGPIALLGYAWTYKKLTQQPVVA